MPHFFSVDVEEHFQVSAFEKVAPPSSWDRYPSRVEANTDRLLDLLGRHGATGTFFTLGWVAQRHPALVRRIADAGHEIGSHGWWHRRVTTTEPEAFRADVRDSKALLEDLSGGPVLGYRAPSFSIVEGGEWALDVLIEEGYTYDSSLFPIRRRGYGYPAGGTDPYILQRPGGVLREFPPATTEVGGVRLPAGGGGYLRHFPFGLIRRAFQEREASDVPGMLYTHPWEVDPDQPRLPVGRLTSLRHYRGLGRTLHLLNRLLTEFRFVSVAEWLAVERPAA